MHSFWGSLVCAAIVCIAASDPARAGAGPFSEVRLGVLNHDINFGSGHERGVDIAGELLFASPVPADAVASVIPELRWLLRPRVHVGFLANTSGHTNQGHAGLTWTAPLAAGLFLPGDALVVEGEFGGSVNDGHVTGQDGRAKALGSNVLFCVAGDIGYLATPHWAIYLEVAHESNAGFARENQGLTQVGVLVGYRF